MGSQEGAPRGGMPWSQAREVGDHGEDVACAHVQTLGWVVLDRNWRCRQGEIDLVARDGRELVFCEVKTRRSERFGSPVEAINPAKARRLRRLAWAWLAAHGAGAPSFRIDVIGVLLHPGGRGVARLDHLQAVA